MYNLTTVGWNIGVILHPPLTSAPSLGTSSVILSSSNSTIWFSPRMASLEEYSSLTRCTVYSKLLLCNNIVHLLLYESHHSSWQQNVFPCYAALSQGRRGWQCTLSPHPLLSPPVHWTGTAPVNRTMSDQRTSHVFRAAWMCRADSPGSKVLLQMRAWWSRSSSHSAVFRLLAAAGMDLGDEDATRIHRWPTGDCQETGTVQLHWPWCLVDTGQHQLAESPGVCEVWTHGHPRRRFGMS